MATKLNIALFLFLGQLSEIYSDLEIEFHFPEILL